MTRNVQGSELILYNCIFFSPMKLYSEKMELDMLMDGRVILINKNIIQSFFQLSLKTKWFVLIFKKFPKKYLKINDFMYFL